MVKALPVQLAVGVILGFLSGLGIGGGSLLVLWLTEICGTSQEIARTTNLLFFLPSAAIATLMHRKQGRLPAKNMLLPAIVCGCVLAALCSLILGKTDHRLVKKAFGILLLVTGIREIRYRAQSPTG